jgi:hypothetical protein
MTDGALQVAAYWAYKYEPTPAAFDMPFLPFALFSQTFYLFLTSSCLISSFSSIDLKTCFHHVWGKDD